MDVDCLDVVVAPLQVMSNINFIKLLKEYDKDNIKPATIKKLQKYVTK